ncbi:hypothetical protein DPMN_069981 [Dreissena polymorpha]|uniref:Uncharacterized protein n=1 Tax=Dreissena polymorpha TaxID=45954 RepID=A0A9D3Z257_DREPO|nr:hypothetical protein DPMN_069981 [Dreissena polymorpha]
MDTSVTNRTESTPPRIKIRDHPGKSVGFLEFLSVDGLPKTITKEAARYPLGPTRTNTDSPGSNKQSTRRPHGQSRTNTAEIRIAPDKHGPTRYLHVPTRTYTTTPRINTASIRTRTKTNLYKSMLIFGDSINSAVWLGHWLVHALHTYRRVQYLFPVE